MIAFVGERTCELLKRRPEKGEIFVRCESEGKQKGFCLFENQIRLLIASYRSD
jgi:hypothetical protein